MKVLLTPVKAIKRRIAEVKFSIWKKNWDSFTREVQKDADKALGRKTKTESEKLDDAIDYFRRQNSWNQLVEMSKKDVQEIKDRNEYFRKYGKFPN